MKIEDIKVGMRVRRVVCDNWLGGVRVPIGTVGVVTGQAPSGNWVVVSENTDIPSGPWHPDYMEFVSAGPVPSETYAGASQASAPRGRKDDSGKLDMNLLDDMPRALKAITEVMQWAITEKKPEPYKRASWLGVHPDRYRAAIKRHDREACEMATQMATLDDARYQRDKETNLLHLAHMACSAMMALENTLRDMEVYKK